MRGGNQRVMGSVCGGPLTPVLSLAPWDFGSSRSRGVMVTFTHVLPFEGMWLVQFD